MASFRGGTRGAVTPGTKVRGGRHFVQETLTLSPIQPGCPLCSLRLVLLIGAQHIWGGGGGGNLAGGGETRTVMEVRVASGALLLSYAYLTCL